MPGIPRDPRIMCADDSLRSYDMTSKMERHQNLPPLLFLHFLQDKLRGYPADDRSSTSRTRSFTHGPYKHVGLVEEHVPNWKCLSPDVYRTMCLSTRRTLSNKTDLPLNV